MIITVGLVGLRSGYHRNLLFREKERKSSNVTFTNSGLIKPSVYLSALDIPIFVSFLLPNPLGNLSAAFP